MIDLGCWSARVTDCLRGEDVEPVSSLSLGRFLVVLRGVSHHAREGLGGSSRASLRWLCS